MPSFCSLKPNSLLKLVILAAFAVATMKADTVDVSVGGPGGEPGFTMLSIDGTRYQALGYTGQFQAPAGDSWAANAIDLTNIASVGTDLYYGPQDEDNHTAQWLSLYQEDLYLFSRLQADHNADQVTRIIDAVYYLSGAHGYTANDYVQEAQNAVQNHQVPDGAGFWAIDPPLDGPHHEGFLVFAADGVSTPQGSGGAVVPEPGYFGALAILVGLVGLVRK